MIVRAWYSHSGAGQGTPWYVQHEDGSCELITELDIKLGVMYGPYRIRGKFNPQGFEDLPEGPRAIIEIE